MHERWMCRPGTDRAASNEASGQDLGTRRPRRGAAWRERGVPQRGRRLSVHAVTAGRSNSLSNARKPIQHNSSWLVKKARYIDRNDGTTCRILALREVQNVGETLEICTDRFGTIPLLSSRVDVDIG